MYTTQFFGYKFVYSLSSGLGSMDESSEVLSYAWEELKVRVVVRSGVNAT